MGGPPGQHGRLRSARAKHVGDRGLAIANSHSITVLLFGPQAALAGQREVIVTVAEPTAGRVLDALAEAAEPLAPSLPASRLAVNHEFVGDEHVIRLGDEVALIGMVSGG